MATDPKQPSKPSKPAAKPRAPASGARRGRPRKVREDDAPKRETMTLPRSLLDTTIADGEEYHPGDNAKPTQEPAADTAPAERGNEALPSKPVAPSSGNETSSAENDQARPSSPPPQGGEQRQTGGPRPQNDSNRQHPNAQGGRHDRRFDRNRDRRQGGQPFHQQKSDEEHRGYGGAERQQL